MKRNDTITLAIILVWCVVIPALLYLFVLIPAAEIHGY